jgi:hypothetical protein
MFHPTRTLLLLSLALLVPAAAQDDKKANEEAAKKAVDEFTEKVKAAKAPQDKALAILALGDFEPKDNCMVAPIGKYLGAISGDLNYLCVTAAADALGRFRGSPKAAMVLQGALAGYKKIPYLAARINMAIGRVGHEASLAMFDEQLKGLDPEQAAQAVWAIAEFPPAVAVDALFRENVRIDLERKKQNLKDEYKKVYDRSQPEILKAVKKLTAQPWPTMAEQTIWWNKHKEGFKEEAARKEKEAKAQVAAPASRSSLPPVLLVELLFKENTGTSTANSGASCATFSTAIMTANKPAWSNILPPNGAGAAIDFDKTGGAYAIDLGGGAGVDNLKNLKSFTITGWTICWESKEGPSDKQAGAGNRILSWYNPIKTNEGVELVYRSDGSLQLGIGEWAEASAARSKPAQIPTYDSKATEAGGEQYRTWRFFAVTYDSGVAAGHAKFYVGTRNADAKLVNAADYNRGPSGLKIAQQLTVGNVTPQIRPMAPDRGYRGILDELRIYGSTIDGAGALPVEELVKIQNKDVPKP